MIIRKVDLFSKATLNPGGLWPFEARSSRSVSQQRVLRFFQGWEAMTSMTWRKPGRKLLDLLEQMSGDQAKVPGTRKSNAGCPCCIKYSDLSKAKGNTAEGQLHHHSVPFCTQGTFQYKVIQCVGLQGMQHLLYCQ